MSMSPFSVAGEHPIPTLHNEKGAFPVHPSPSLGLSKLLSSRAAAAGAASAGAAAEAHQQTGWR